MAVTGKFTMTVNATKGGGNTKTLSLDGSTLNATWAVGERVTVHNDTRDADLEGYLEAQNDGAETILAGTITGTVKAGDVLTLKFNEDPDYSSQDGTLAYIATHCDYAVAAVTVSGISDGNIKTTGHADFVNQQAIVKFTLKDKDDESALSVNKLFVTAGGTTCEVTPGGATSEFYVAVPAIASVRVTLTALSGSTYYDYVQTGVTFAQSQYYTINASLTEVKDMDCARTVSLGRVVAADHKMYASVESAANAGTTALAVIARKHSELTRNEFTAIAISDESGTMTWSEARNAIDNKTPEIGGGSWQFPSVNEWENMFWANGGDQNSYTGLNALISKAGGTPLRSGVYWTATDDPSNSDYKCDMHLYISTDTVSFDTGIDQSGRLFVRAFLNFQSDYSLYDQNLVGTARPPRSR